MAYRARMTTNTPMSQGRKVTLAVVLLVLSAGIFWYTSRPDDESAFTGIAYPCLPMDKTTTDPAEFVMVTGYRTPPNEHTLPDGTVVYAVFSHPDPKVVPKVAGNTLYFPARLIGEDEIETPPLPPRNLPLPKSERFSLVRYLSPETVSQLKSALTGSGSPPAQGTTP